MVERNEFVTIKNEDKLNSGFFNGIHDIYNISGKNTIRQLQDRSIIFNTYTYGDAYIDDTGRNNTVSTGSSSARFNSDQYEALLSDNYVIIKATSISSKSDFEINNCFIGQISFGNWMLTSTSTDSEVAKAEIYKTLFYGTDGTNPRASASYITGITEIQTSYSEDIGKRAYYAIMTEESNNDSDLHSLTMTFNESINADFYAWYYMHRDNSASGGGDVEIYWNGVEKDELHLNGSGSMTHDYTDTDNSLLTEDNPTTIVFDMGGVKYTDAIIRAFFLCDGTLSEVYDPTSTPADGSYSITDFYTDNSIPLFTIVDVDVNALQNQITHDLPENIFDDATNMIMVPLISNWEDGNDIKFKLYVDETEETGWLDAGNNPMIIPFINELNGIPTKIIIRLIIKDTNPTTGYPAIKGFMIKSTN